VADVAAIAIIAGATTTLGVPVVGMWADARRADRERSDREVEELRALLDEAALVLDEARVAMRHVERLLQDKDQDQEQVRDAYAHQRRAIRRVRARLSIRLGINSDVTIAFDAAVDVLDRMHRSVNIAVVFTDEKTRADSAKRLIELRPRYKPAVDRYVEAAREIAGTLMPRQRGRRR
jgi:hypothetical protein